VEAIDVAYRAYEIRDVNKILGRKLKDITERPSHGGEILKRINTHFIYIKWVKVGIEFM